MIFIGCSSMVFENGRLCKDWGEWACGEDGGFRDGYEIGQNISLMNSNLGKKLQKLHILDLSLKLYII